MSTDDTKLIQTRIPKKTHAFVEKDALANGFSIATWLRRLILATEKGAKK